MSPEGVRVTSEHESRQVAEQARQSEWEGRGFLRDLFLGRFDIGLIHPFPLETEERPEFRRFYDGMEAFLRDRVDPAAIDRAGEYPPEVIDGLRSLGAFGMKIPKEYGGLGFSAYEYCKVMEMVGSYDGNISALLSAHQSIGVPQPLKLFGTEAQKRKYLPRCAAGAISAFALTEPHVGSDPASLSTTAERRGDHYLLNGEKLWCTNGTIAELLVVMARDPQTKKISAFVVETGWEGVKVEYRCRFMGLRALANGVISFDNVRVPKENLIGEEGKGLKIALITLNTGRLTIPALCAGFAKRCVGISRGWAGARVQWGVPIAKHEVIAHRIADMAATTFALDSVWQLASRLADRGGYDIRLEAAAAKEWNTTRAYAIVDQTLQIRGGRGYETETSLAGRGESPIGVERMLRDTRINLIFEGSSEVMHLFMAREAVDRHLEVAGAMIDPKKRLGEKLAAMPKVARFYAGWYPALWVRRWGSGARYREFGRLAPHLAFVERSSRRLARASFHAMTVYGAKMERKQAFLFRLVDIAMELFVMAAAVSHARALEQAGRPGGARAVELADLFCRNARRLVGRLFHDLWKNDDVRKNRVAASIMAGEERWLETGAFDLGLAPESFQARSLRAPQPSRAREEVEAPSRTQPVGTRRG
jgi:alkylation response protein AidB-like acyl-CoA dehydrogenase